MNPSLVIPLNFDALLRRIFFRQADWAYSVARVGCKRLAIHRKYPEYVLCHKDKQSKSPSRMRILRRAAVGRSEYEYLIL